jgi:hypothetical protein
MLVAIAGAATAAITRVATDTLVRFALFGSLAFAGKVPSLRDTACPAISPYAAEARGLLIEIARDGAYTGVDINTVSGSLNYLVHGAWYWDHLNPSSRDTDVLRKTMLLLHQAFPRHFELMP